MSQASSSAAPLQNIYYERKVATARPCYICKRPTATVLATIKTEDFLYTCDGHLSDPGFASPISPPSTPAPGPSADDIKKVIADYQAREARKGEKGKDKDGEKKDDKSKSGESDKDKDKDKKKKTDGAVSPPSIPLTTPSPAATHRKFALHRQIFDMRRADLKRKTQGVQAKEVSKGLPQVPRGAF